MFRHLLILAVQLRARRISKSIFIRTCHAHAFQDISAVLKCLPSEALHELHTYGTFGIKNVVRLHMVEDATEPVVSRVSDTLQWDMSSLVQPVEHV